MADLDLATDRLGVAVDVAARLDPSGVELLQARLEAVRQRRGFPGDTVVVALVGGTGSGKSSLLNALAGREVSPAGVLRPTTDEPRAWVPAGAEAGVARFLDALEVQRRVTDERLADLVVIDLPDHDSVEVTHRATVDHLLPRVDLVVWVLDPLKYNDRVVHRRIAARATYADQFLFVLNRSDQVQPDDLDAVRDDLRASLRDDGVADPTVLVTVAAARDGPPRGVDDLGERLHTLVRRKGIVAAKLAEDLRVLVDDLTTLVGATEPADDDPVTAWGRVRAEAATGVATAVVDGSALTRAERAGMRTAARAGSGPLGRAWHRLRTAPAGRALGLPQDGTGSATPAPASARAEHADAGVATLLRGLHDLAPRLGERGGGRLRAMCPPERLDDEVQGALAGAQRATRADDRVVPRGWWRGMAVLQALLTVAVGVGAVWLWADPTAVRPGEVPWPLLLLVGGIAAGVLVTRVLRSSGRRAGRRHALVHREVLAAAVADRLQDRLGDVEQALRDHDHLVRLLAEAGRALDDGRWRASTRRTASTLP